MTIQSKTAAAVTGDAPSAQNSKNTLVTKGQDNKPRQRLLAELGLSPILPNTTTARCFAKATTMGELDLTESVAVMREKASAVHLGNLAGLEETLTAQAVALAGWEPGPPDGCGGPRAYAERRRDAVSWATC